jgi:2-dehydro-3-deoxyphosphogluconate aldolase/(4S)-4-hydroxy-2-oxoglutarate aldolase
MAVTPPATDADRSDAGGRQAWMDARAAVDKQLTARQVMQDAPVIPVIVLSDTTQAVLLAKALVAGGIRMLEVTLRTPQALACIEAIARQVPDAVVGAGTLRSAADAQACSMAGARFAVSPGYTQALGQACSDLGLPLLPGVATGSEIMMAQEAGLSELKFFPAMQAGGPAMLKAWSGPFGDVRFCPTGGVSAANASDFLALPNVVCVGGSWLTPADAVEQGDWSRITELALDACKLVRRAVR